LKDIKPRKGREDSLGAGNLDNYTKAVAGTPCSECNAKENWDMLKESAKESCDTHAVIYSKGIGILSRKVRDDKLPSREWVFLCGIFTAGMPPNRPFD
jgi:hypothetical protein